MVREDFPEPETPVTTTSLFLGMETSMFFRLWTLAPLIYMASAGLGPDKACPDGAAGEIFCFFGCLTLLEDVPIY
jgi:hypothetical protein